MERFLEIGRTSSKPRANKATEALEDAGITVMIEYVQLKSGADSLPGFRVLVPSDSVRSASRLIGSNLS